MELSEEASGLGREQAGYYLEGFNEEQSIAGTAQELRCQYML
jgi:hypothetical protein